MFIQHLLCLQTTQRLLNFKIENPLPLHPGKVLAEVYIAEMGLNQSGVNCIILCSFSILLD